MMNTMTMLKKLAQIMISKARYQGVELDGKIKGFDGIGNNSKYHYVIRAIIKSTPQNVISFYPVEHEFRVFVPYVSDGNEFKKRYGFNMLGIASEGSTKDRVWARIEGEYFQPLFEQGGDSGQILKFLCAVNKPYYIPTLENTDESINEIRAALGFEKIETVTEGTSRYSMHKSRERDQRIVQLKLQEASENNIHLACEVCGLSMKTIYGSYGENVCEVHHRTPLFLLKEEESTATSLDDLAILCPNCHRVIHRDKENPITVDQLREIVQQNSVSDKVL